MDKPKLDMKRMNGRSAPVEKHGVGGKTVLGTVVETRPATKATTIPGSTKTALNARRTHPKVRR